jgi:hypothetical protein
VPQHEGKRRRSSLSAELHLGEIVRFNLGGGFFWRMTGDEDCLERSHTTREMVAIAKESKYVHLVYGVRNFVFHHDLQSSGMFGI